jgi:hypothetical protein
VDIVLSNIRDFKPGQRYDYISIIDAFSGAPSMFGGERPNEDLLKAALELLEADGTLLVVVENALGFQRMAGKSDHAGAASSLERDRFTKRELSELLSTVGLQSQEWFYPFPDHRFPRLLFSQHAAPGQCDEAWKLCRSAPTGRGGPSEREWGRLLSGAGLFHECANSFLVVARRTRDLCRAMNCVRFGAADPRRLPQYQLQWTLTRQGTEAVFIKQAAVREAQPFLALLPERDLLARRYLEPWIEVVTGTADDRGVAYPHLPFHSLQHEIGCSLRAGSETKADYIVGEYCDFIRSLPQVRTCPAKFFETFGIQGCKPQRDLTCLTAGALDLVPANILRGPNSWYSVDHEWFFDFPVPIQFVIYRGVRTLLANLQDDIQIHTAFHPGQVHPAGLRRRGVPEKWLAAVVEGEIPIDVMDRWEDHFQAYVLGSGSAQMSRLVTRRMYSVLRTLRNRLTRHVRRMAQAQPANPV